MLLHNPLLHQFPTFEIILRPKGRRWRWRVCSTNGTIVMQGSRSTRNAARYDAHSALFLLLLSTTSSGWPRR
ncbi:hypothetical protein EAS56_23925 [Bradyrhizobium guangzhouense]|uniref:DUF1508 domain-containing protein n=1 Tax=Bradyrhizobium guangzhouense TaxID=1325095 RepID=A0AAE5WWK4_9BRAD|nr:hypothetical protein XH91_03055 [Bradyrhizobium guangzhouense]RXH10000.1 hypothetical protein EAS56_23925 [Bradyrhizobium guangzhouense]